MATITNEDLKDFIINETNTLKEIENELKTFNIFDVLRVSHREIRHSNFIGWLLDPNQNHGFGDYFLQSFINQLPNLDNAKLIDYNLSNLYNTKILRESENDIDIFIINEELSFSIAIENKIGHKEGDKQLKKYYEHVTHKYEHIANNYFVFLTPWGRDSVDIEMRKIYKTFDYGTIIKLFQEGIEQFENINTEIKNSIYQYINSVKRNVLNMDNTTKKAQEVYQKYQTVIDFIYNSKPDFVKIKKKVRAFIEQHNDYTIISPDDNRFIRFLPNDKSFQNIFYYPKANSWEGTDYQ